MADLKKYKRYYLLLFVILFLTFIFIFRNIALLDNANKGSTDIVNHLYFFNGILIISILILCIMLVVKINNEIRIQNLTTDSHIELSNNTDESEIHTENFEKEIQKKLNLLENILSFEKSKEKLFDIFLNEIVKQTESVQAGLFLTVESENKKMLRFNNGYAFYVSETDPVEIYFGEGLSGQVAIDKKLLNLSEIKVDRMPVYSGMGSSVPQNLIICPLINDNETIGVIELASFKKYDLPDEYFVEKAATLLSNCIEKNILNNQGREGENEKG